MLDLLGNCRLTKIGPETQEKSTPARSAATGSPSCKGCFPRELGARDARSNPEALNAPRFRFGAFLSLDPLNEMKNFLFPKVDHRHKPWPGWPPEIVLTPIRGLTLTVTWRTALEVAPIGAAPRDWTGNVATPKLKRMTERKRMAGFSVRPPLPTPNHPSGPDQIRKNQTLSLRARRRAWTRLSSKAARKIRGRPTPRPRRSQALGHAILRPTGTPRRPANHASHPPETPLAPLSAGLWKPRTLHCPRRRTRGGP